MLCVCARIRGGGPRRADGERVGGGCTVDRVRMIIMYTNANTDTDTDTDTDEAGGGRNE